MYEEVNTPFEKAEKVVEEKFDVWMVNHGSKNRKIEFFNNPYIS